MSLEQIIEALTNMGLNRTDAEIYVYIAKKGAHSERELESALKYSTTNISRSLKALITLKLVNKKEQLFSAIPFEEALNLLIQKQKEEKHSIEKLKNQINF